MYIYYIYTIYIYIFIYIKYIYKYIYIYIYILYTKYIQKVTSKFKTQEHKTRRVLKSNKSKMGVIIHMQS